MMAPIINFKFPLEYRISWSIYIINVTLALILILTLVRGIMGRPAGTHQIFDLFFLQFFQMQNVNRSLRDYREGEEGVMILL